jgi:hypothetical protein
MCILAIPCHYSYTETTLQAQDWDRLYHVTVKFQESETTGKCTAMIIIRAVLDFGSGQNVARFWFLAGFAKWRIQLLQCSIFQLFLKKTDIKLPNLLVPNLVWKMLPSRINDRGRIGNAVFADDYHTP